MCLLSLMIHLPEIAGSRAVNRRVASLQSLATVWGLGSVEKQIGHVRSIAPWEESRDWRTARCDASHLGRRQTEAKASTDI